jgi:hypothetical protein
MTKERGIYFTCYDNQLLRTAERDPNISKARFGLERLPFSSCRFKNTPYEI